MSTKQALLAIEDQHQAEAFVDAGKRPSGQAHPQWINTQTENAVEHCLLRLDPVPGESVLEIATGSGTTAERLALQGVQVSAIDTRKERIDIASQVNDARDVDYRVGHPELLPFETATFDGVVFTFDVDQISDPTRAASELARVTKRGGRIALATWSPWDGASEMFDMVHSLGLSGGSPSPSLFDWGQSWWLEQLLGESFELGFEVGRCDYLERNPRSAWQRFAHRSGSNVTRFDPALDTGVRSKFEAFHERYRTDLGIQIPRTYLITIGRRD